MLITNDESICNNRAITFYSKGDYKTALKWFIKALSPNCDKQIIYNIGLCYHTLTDYKNALKYYELYESKIGTDIYEKSLVYLLTGDYKNGLKYYHKRYGRNSLDGVSFPNIPLKWIDNEIDLIDKKILVLNEQGFGDEFLFSISLEYLSKTCKSAVVQVYQENLTLFKELYKFDNIEFFTDRSLSIEFVSNFDSYTSTGENFTIFNRFDIKQSKYKEIESDTGRVGIFFQANSLSKNAKERSIDPNIFRKISDKYKLVNLQKGTILDFAENPKLDDFWDTKKVIDTLDFVITIDSSVANLCGLLGKETYLVKKKYLDWRYICGFYESIDVIGVNEIINL
jgi:tetratricopeptide (TPR) repeat protein